MSFAVRMMKPILSNQEYIRSFATETGNCQAMAKKGLRWAVKRQDVNAVRNLLGKESSSAAIWNVREFVQMDEPSPQAKEIVDLFLKKVDVNDIVDLWENTSLHVVANREVAKLLIDSNANVNALNGMNNSPLDEQIKKNNLHVVGKLLDGGAKLSSLSLFAAVANDNAEMVKKLVIPEDRVNIPDQHGRTPLHYAQSPEVAIELLSIGADLEATDEKGRTPLLHQLKQNRGSQSFFHLIQFFLMMGADPNAADSAGRTSLFYTVHGESHFCVRCAELLLKYGARLTEKDLDGNTVYFFASNCKNRMAVDYFSKLIDLAFENGSEKLF